MTDAMLWGAPEPDEQPEEEIIRKYVSELWSEDWSSAEDAVYDKDFPPSYFYVGGC